MPPVCTSRPDTPPTFLFLRRSLSHLVKPEILSQSAADGATPPGDGSQFRRRGQTPFLRFIKLARRRTDGSVDVPPEESPVRAFGRRDETQASVISLPSEISDEAVGDVPSVTPSVERIGDFTEVDTSAESAGHEETAAGEHISIPEPASLARRIQALVSSLPSWAAQSSSATSGSPDVPVSGTFPAFITDSKLVSFLSSPSIMNGEASQGRPSMWTLLDRLQSSGHTPSPRVDANGDAHPATEEGSTVSSDDDSSSFMLYAPLVPDDSSEVEVARSEVISLDENASITSYREPKTRSVLSRLWPFSSPDVAVADERKVWIPSPTKVSLELRWWGYRVYLPPPVLAILDNQRIEASKRAALLTTALKWLLDHIPTAAIPPQARPALQLLGTLVPYLAYLGAFVVWSWSAIKTFDKGNGVILTATWLLPLALIPGSWDDTPSNP